MGTVVIHAGMPKTGSTSIQDWLAQSSSGLRRGHDVRVLVAEPRPGPRPGVRVVPYRPGGRINSGRVIRFARRARPARKQIAEELAAQIAEHAAHHEAVVLTSEAFAQLFWRPERPFVRALGRLARTHPVRVAYYVRPQHTSLEAAWRQWGFRSKHSPSRYLERRAEQLHYFETLLTARKHAKRVAFEPRPFRTDLLESGDVVVDFARRFLGIDDPRALPDGARPAARLALGARARRWFGRGGPAGEQRGKRNLGLPLEVVNALSEAPPHVLGRSMHDNRRFDVLKELVSELSIAESEETRRSRALLHAYAFRVFEEENRRLIAELGWQTESFIPPPEPGLGDERRELQRLDELWRPRASRSELELLYSVLDEALATRGAPLAGVHVGQRDV